MARPTVKIWFDETPLALEYLQLGRKVFSYRVLVRNLRERFQYPFKDHTSLMDFANMQLGPVEKPPIKARKPVTLTPVLPGERTRSDIRLLEQNDTFFCTSAVNNSPANLKFVAALHQWEEYTGGTVTCNPVRYKNPTRQGEVRQDEWWAEELKDWMLLADMHPHPKLTLMTAKAAATANNPLPPRLDSLTKAKSAIFGHPQLCMRGVPSYAGSPPKILYTTGAATRPVYSDTLAGRMAEFHHSIGGVIVEIRGAHVFMREVIWDGEKFTDLDTDFWPEGVYTAERPLALVSGDTHLGWEDSRIMNALYGPRGIAQTLKPERLFLHDLFDGHSVNPHEKGDLSRAMTYQEGKTNLDRELDRVSGFLQDVSPIFDEVNIVASNHHDFLWRWLDLGARRVEPENRELFHYLSYKMLEQARNVKDARKRIDAFEMAMQGRGVPDSVSFLKLDGTYALKDIEMAIHGHLGANGATGNIKTFARLSMKSISGHGHGGLIWQGARRVGHAGAAFHGYNHGLSSWDWTQAIVGANHKSQMLHCIGEEWRG